MGTAAGGGIYLDKGVTATMDGGETSATMLSIRQAKQMAAVLLSEERSHLIPVRFPII